ncbi:ROK family protein [Chryseobacterium carnipullorum]|uniref:N-acetyl-D-glucosamine kinase n=1 Tax=Chryseobacterium carnipullorum TaxID=1124835 RepID=A0A376EKK1_CHRCU|nr:ROK family protein [Chryseobacterium carnipullorum]AZA47585.1 ROK family protein [Chryseobacterium carnipullorum]AZA66915.1 ROK family protein [Chryseobacterium carnipullorum]STD10726.1 N-acetyl-D-glucosamine kinase [Chryseobacterium carnipullorum]
MQNIVGIDIGGSHITMAQVDPDKREIISATYVREHVDSFGPKETIFSAWISAIEKVTHDLVKSDLLIGIAMPGPFDYENGISLMQQGKFIDIYQVNIKNELAERLSIYKDQIHFVNDAGAFLEGEVFGGCVRDYKRIFGVTLGTGLGTAFYNGEVASDEDLWDSPFKDSICEDYLATRWFVNHYKALTGREISGTKDLLDRSEEIQTKIFEDYADSFADFIVKYVRNYEPEVLVIGGNIAKVYPYFKNRLNKHLEEYKINLPIKISAIFEDAAILGAAGYALKKSNR